MNRARRLRGASRVVLRRHKWTGRSGELRERSWPGSTRGVVLYGYPCCSQLLLLYMMLFLAAIQAVAFLLFIAPKAGAQSQLPQGLIDGIGTPCLLSLSSLLSNDDLNKCLQLNEAITTFGAVKSNDSLVPALNTFLTQDFCPADACQQSTLTSANDTLYQSCTSDIESGKNPILKLLPAFLKDYTPIKTATCLQDTKANDQNCIVQTLTYVRIPCCGVQD